jgi:hypothetical protein
LGGRIPSQQCLPSIPGFLLFYLTFFSIFKKSYN